MTVADVAACYALSNPAWCRIFREKYLVSPLSILGHVSMSLGKALNPQMLHLTQVEMSTWLTGDGNVYDKFNVPKCLQSCMLSMEKFTQMNRSIDQGGGG